MKDFYDHHDDDDDAHSCRIFVGTEALQTETLVRRSSDQLNGQDDQLNFVEGPPSYDVNGSYQDGDEDQSRS